MIRYRTDYRPSPDEFITLLQQTTLGARRPLHDAATVAAMLEHADIIATAWQDQELVGIARSLTDFRYCCYLSDLAVAESHQHQGIGQALIRATESLLHTGCMVVLLTAPQATGYYGKIGFLQHPSAWTKTVGS